MQTLVREMYYPRLKIHRFKRRGAKHATISEQLENYQRNSGEFDNAGINTGIEKIKDILTGKNSKYWFRRLNEFDSQFDEFEKTLSSEYNRGMITEAEVLDAMQRVRDIFDITVTNNKYFRKNYGAGTFKDLGTERYNKINLQLNDFKLMKENPKSFVKITKMRQGLLGYIHTSYGGQTNPSLFIRPSAIKKTFYKTLDWLGENSAKINERFSGGIEKLVSAVSLKKIAIPEYRY